MVINQTKEEEPSLVYLLPESEINVRIKANQGLFKPSKFISYSSIALIKHPDQGNLEKEGFISEE